MRLPRFRLKLWMFAILVALVGVGIGAERTIRRVAGYRRLAASYAAKDAEDRQNLARAERTLARATERFGGSPGFERTLFLDWQSDAAGRIAELRRRIERSARLRRQYERACRFPWPSVAPDPLTPE